MPTQFQHLFNRWMERNYNLLRKQMPLHDIMHDAYVTVYHIRRPILPTDERFRSLMDDAYHRHMLEEFNHQMHFTLPDPIFWLLLDEDENRNELPTASHTNHSLSDLSVNSMKNLFSFVRKNFSVEEVAIFNMAVMNQMTYAEIARAMGRTKPEIRNTINKIEQAIRQCRKTK